MVMVVAGEKCKKNVAGTYIMAQKNVTTSLTKQENNVTVSVLQ